MEVLLLAKGKTIYFSRAELEALLKVLEEWQDKVDEDVYSHRMKYGLGTAWGKIYKKDEKKSRD